MSADMQREREQFSNWAESLDMDMTLLDVDSQEVYSDCNTDYAWQAWQAARRSQGQEWISVEERLPEQWGYYNVCCDTDDGPEVLPMQFEPVEKHWIYDGKPTFCFSFFVKPTHWMPLPAAPSGEGRNPTMVPESNQPLQKKNGST